MEVTTIGSGMSGLFSGATLEKTGDQVTIFEQFERVGSVTAPVGHKGK